MMPSLRWTMPATVAGLSVLLVGCRGEPPYEGAFEVPVAADVLGMDRASPFSEPIGFVASGTSGQISILALKQGRFLTDDDTAGFLRGNPLATGQGRVLSGVAVYAPSRYRVEVFATDRAYEELVRVPYIVDFEDGSCFVNETNTRDGCTTDADCGDDGVCIGTPVEARASLSDPPVLRDVTGAETSGAQLTKLEVKTGYTTTETWTLTFDGEGWVVEGSRSGPQEYRAFPGEPYVAERRTVGFTVKGGAQVGDTFTFGTDNGAVAFDLGGRPLHLSLQPDQARLATVVQDRVLDRPVLRWVDPESGVVLGEPLPPTAKPGRLTWSEDGTRLLTGDLEQPIVWEVGPDDSVVQHDVPWPVFDVAHMDDGELEQVFLVPVDDDTLWRMDLASGSLIDVNPYMAGDQGLDLHSPIGGIAAVPVPHLYAEYTDYGVRKQGRSVAVTLHSGRVVFAEETTGCLMRDSLGPRSAVSGSVGQSQDYATNFDGLPAPAFLEQNAHNTRHVLVAPCAGLARTENWSIRFDKNRQHWVARGSLSGEQVNVAYEDERYVSDNGAISFVIRSGGTPSEDGWLIEFSVVDGAMAANGDDDGDGLREIRLSNMGDPVPYQYRVGPRDGGWAKIDERALVLVTAQGSNSVGRVDPQEGDVDARWD
ncbi:MAG: hypothetical protein ACI8PZ_001751 [Myxococcota bacterium]|jgi:hypothetical protein